jgi:hypothetical protein
MPVGVERLFDGHDFSFSPWTGQGRETFEFWVDAADYDATIEAIIGPVTTFSSGWGASVSRRLPMEHPYRPGLRAVNASVRGRGKSSATNLYSSYQFRVDFEVPPYEAGGDTPMMSVRRAYSANFVTIPGKFLHMETPVAGVVRPLEHDQAVPIPQVAYQLTLFGVGATNVAAIAAACAAPMNSTTLVLRGATAEPGYALFGGVEDQHDFGVSGQVTKAVSYRFLLRSGLRFDQIISPFTGLPDRPLKMDNQPIVAASDLNLLFR